MASPTGDRVHDPHTEAIGRGRTRPEPQPRSGETTRSLKAALAGLLAAVFVPLVAAGGAFVAHQWSRESEQAIERLRDEARALRDALDRELALDQAVLRALAASRDVDDQDWRRFDAVARQASGVRPASWILVLDRDGQQRVNTAAPLGAPLPNMTRIDGGATHGEWRGHRIPLADGRAMLKIFDDGEPKFSGLALGRVVDRPVVASGVPAVRDGAPRYALVLVYAADFFQGLVRTPADPRDTIKVVVDGTGLVIARNRAPEAYVGGRAAAPFAGGTARLPAAGVGDGRTIEGLDAYFAYHRSTLADWVVVVAQPKSTVLAPAWRTLALSVAILLGAALLGAMSALRLWRRLALPLDALARQARSIDGSPIETPASDIEEVATLDRALREAAENERRRRRTEQDREEARRELQRANERLEEADRRRTEFLSMLSHELRNPLAPILNSVRMLQLADGQPTPRARAVDIVGRQTKHLAHLVGDLVDATRIISGKMNVEMGDTTLQAIVEHAIDIVHPVVEARRIELRLRLPDEPVRLRADAVRLAQVVSNLLHNAAKFSEPGSAVSLSARVDDGRLEIAVEDHGAGIEPSLAPRIFDLFVQGDQTVARTEGGLGVGLALVRRIVELHGGSVAAHSDGPGTGSRFVVRLPLVADPPAAAHAVAPAGRHAGSA